MLKLDNFELYPDTEKLDNACVTSRLNYGNALHFYLPVKAISKLQTLPHAYTTLILYTTLYLTLPFCLFLY